jgi:acetolactate synthase I/II/III large subunit
LEEEGVDTIFGVPGEENADLMISLLDSPIEFIICRHEQAAAFMADMYGRLTGKPGVCLATLGPGATNLITGVASATLDYSPLVAIIGQGTTTRLHKESHQNMDSIAMFKPVTKWASSLYDAGNIPEVVHKAFKLARDEKPGATLIELPEDIAKAETDSQPIRISSNQRHLRTDIHLIEEALQLISKAKTPIVLNGWGVVRSGASDLIEEFVNTTSIYAANTFMGKGALSARNPFCLYTVGLGSRDIVLDAFQEADLVMCVGYDMVEWHPEKWNTGADKTIIHIDTRAAEVDSHYETDVEIIGDIPETLREINKRLNSEHKKSTPQFENPRAMMTHELTMYDADDGFPMKPQRILSDLRSVMRDDDILISDVGAHKMWVARHYRTYAPNSCFITNGLCSMGFALPSAFSAKRLYPQKNVVALCGDGGFLMNVQDLITAARYKIPLTVLIWDDNEYGLIKWKQEASYQKHSHTDLTNPDWMKLADSFGCQGIQVEATNEFVPAMKKAFAETTRPSIVVAPVDYRENLKLTERLGELLCR